MGTHSHQQKQARNESYQRFDDNDKAQLEGEVGHNKSASASRKSINRANDEGQRGENHEISQSSDDHNQEVEGDYKVYSQRWLVLTAFSIFNFSTGMIWICMAPVQDEAQSYYGVGAEAIVLCSTIYLIIFIPLSIPASWFVSKTLRYSLLCGAICNVLGAWIRFIAKDNYSVLITGQAICALANVFVGCAPAEIAEIWFPTREQGKAIAIGVFSNYLGWGIPFPIESYLIRNHFTVLHLVLINAIFASVGFILVLLFVKDHPPTPANKTSECERGSILTDMKTMVKDIHFFTSSFVYGMALGISYSIVTTLTEFLNPNNHHTMEIGYLGILFVGIGAVASFGFEFLIQRGIPYFKTMKALLVLALFSLILLGVGSKEKITWLNYVGTALCGISLIGVTPLCIQCGVEQTFPVSESNSSQFIFIQAQVLSTIISTITSLKSVLPYGWWIMAGCIAASLVLYVFVDFKMKKTDYRLHAARGKSASLLLNA